MFLETATTNRIIKNEKELQAIISKSTIVSVCNSEVLPVNTKTSAITGLNLTSYNQVVQVDRAKQQITVQSGITLQQLYVLIEACGWSLPCIPENSNQIVYDALRDLEHGSCGALLSAAIICYRLVTEEGKVAEITKEHKEVQLLRGGFGQLGVLSEVTFQCENIFKLQMTEASQKIELWLSQWEIDLVNYDYVKVDWFPHTSFVYVYKGEKITDDFKAKTKGVPIHKKQIDSIVAVNRSKKIIVRKNKLLRARYFRIKRAHVGSLYQTTVTNHSYKKEEFKEYKWAIAQGLFAEFWKELELLLHDKENTMYLAAPVAIRFLQKDTIYGSPAHQQNVVTFSYLLHQKNKELQQNLIDFFVEKGAKLYGCIKESKDLRFPKVEHLKRKEYQELKNKLAPKGKIIEIYNE